MIHYTYLPGSITLDYEKYKSLKSDGMVKCELIGVWKDHVLLRETYETGLVREQSRHFGNNFTNISEVNPVTSHYLWKTLYDNYPELIYI